MEYLSVPVPDEEGRAAGNQKDLFNPSKLELVDFCKEELFLMRSPTLGWPLFFLTSSSLSYLIVLD
jgi:hypothetical protein